MAVALLDGSWSLQVQPDKEAMAPSALSGSEEQISARSVGVLIAVLVSLHLGAFFFWIWQLAKQSKKEKKVAID